MRRKKKINYGYVPDVRKPEDYIFGASPIKGEVLQEDGQWDAFLPSDEIQLKSGVETCNCTGFGTLNALEVLHKRKFGTEIDKSDRVLGIMAGTYPPGNSPSVVAQTIHSQGCVDDSVLPFSDDISDVDEYYSPKPLPITITDQAKSWLNQFSYRYEQVFRGYEDTEKKKDLIKEALKHSSLGISVYAWVKNSQDIYYRPSLSPDTHWVCAYGYTDDGVKVLDTYEPTHKIVDWDNIGSAIKYDLQKIQGKPKVSWWAILLGWLFGK